MHPKQSDTRTWPAATADLAPKKIFCDEVWSQLFMAKARSAVAAGHALVTHCFVLFRIGSHLNALFRILNALFRILNALFIDLNLWYKFIILFVCWFVGLLVCLLVCLSVCLFAHRRKHSFDDVKTLSSFDFHVIPCSFASFRAYLYMDAVGMTGIEPPQPPRYRLLVLWWRRRK